MNSDILLDAMAVSRLNTDFLYMCISHYLSLS